MAKKSSPLGTLVTFIAWLTGVIVSLAVGSALISGIIAVPYIGTIVNEVAGWIVVITTLLGAVLAIVNRVR